MPIENLRRIFPNLRDFTITSPEDDRYNCVSWAAGATGFRLWPIGDNEWPPAVSEREDVSAFIDAFALLRFEPCDSGDVEDGWERVAIYALDGIVKHMARQLPNGRWTSKIGDFEDIEHASPGELEGEAYGAVAQFLRRPRAG